MKIMPVMAVAAAVGFGAVRVSETPRAQRAVHVLRGRPLIYGLRYNNGAIRPCRDLRIDNCTFENVSAVPAIEITDGPSSLSRLEGRLVRSERWAAVTKHRRERIARARILP